MGFYVPYLEVVSFLKTKLKFFVLKFYFYSYVASDL